MPVIPAAPTSSATLQALQMQRGHAFRRLRRKRTESTNRYPSTATGWWRAEEQMPGFIGTAWFHDDIGTSPTLGGLENPSGRPQHQRASTLEEAPGAPLDRLDEPVQALALALEGLTGPTPYLSWTTDHALLSTLVPEALQPGGPGRSEQVAAVFAALYDSPPPPQEIESASELRRWLDGVEVRGGAPTQSVSPTLRALQMQREHFYRLRSLGGAAAVAHFPATATGWARAEEAHPGFLEKAQAQLGLSSGRLQQLRTSTLRWSPEEPLQSLDEPVQALALILEGFSSEPPYLSWATDQPLLSRLISEAFQEADHARLDQILRTFGLLYVSLFTPAELKRALGVGLARVGPSLAPWMEEAAQRPVSSAKDTAARGLLAMAVLAVEGGALTFPDDAAVLVAVGRQISPLIEGDQMLLRFVESQLLSEHLDPLLREQAWNALCEGVLEEVERRDPAHLSSSLTGFIDINLSRSASPAVRERFARRVIESIDSGLNPTWAVSILKKLKIRKALRADLRRKLEARLSAPSEFDQIRTLTGLVEGWPEIYRIQENLLRLAEARLAGSFAGLRSAGLEDLKAIDALSERHLVAILPDVNAVSAYHLFGIFGPALLEQFGVVDKLLAAQRLSPEVAAALREVGVSDPRLEEVALGL